jgi:hypothetical protein
MIAQTGPPTVIAGAPPAETGSKPALGRRVRRRRSSYVHNVSRGSTKIPSSWAYDNAPV